MDKYINLKYRMRIGVMLHLHNTPGVDELNQAHRRNIKYIALRNPY